MKAAALLAALLLTGCAESGSDDAPTLSPSAVRDVPERVRAEGSFEFEAAYTREVEGRDDERYLELEGALDLSADVGWMRAELAELFAGLPSADEFEEPVELTWTKSELRARIRAEESVLERERAREDGGLIGRLHDEPRALVELLGKAADVRRIGAETIDGRETVRFACVVDARRAGAAGAPAELTKAFERALHGPTLPLEVWIDGDGLPRRIEYVVRLEPLVSEGKEILPARVVRGTYELSSFGEPVGSPE